MVFLLIVIIFDVFTLKVTKLSKKNQTIKVLKHIFFKINLSLQHKNKQH